MNQETATGYQLRIIKGLKPAFSWFLLSFIVGLILRLVLLDSISFTQSELVLVNQALQISQRVSASTSNVPAYTGMTGLLFFLFGAGDILARLVPALVGASLVLLPWLWKDKIGEKVAFILSLALALDPTFLLFSRAVNGGIFAIGGIIWAITLLKKNQPWLAGAALAIAFLSGPSFWSFLLILGLIQLMIQILRPDPANELYSFSFMNREKQLSNLTAGFAVSALLILTSFLLQPSGLGGVGSGLVAFVRHLSQPYEKPIYHSIFLLLAHSILPLLVFLIGFFRSRSSEMEAGYRIAAISVLISLLVGGLISRESFEILLLPVLICWIGGAIWLARYLLKTTHSWLSTTLLMGFVLTILTYLTLNLGRLSQVPLGTPQFWNILLLIVAGIILIVSAWWLVRFGWSDGNGNQVFLLSLLVFLAILSLGSSMRSLYSEQQVRSLEYLDNQIVLPNDDVEAILADFFQNGKPLQQLGGFGLMDLPEDFSWYFRSFDIERNQPETSMIFTRTSSMPSQTEQYRGMNVVVERSIDFHKEPLTTYLQTFTGKAKPYIDQKGVLWVRTYLFTGASQ